MTRMLAPMVAPAMMPTGKTSTGDGETLAGDRGQGHCQEVAAAGGHLPSPQPRCLQRPRPSWVPQRARRPRCRATPTFLLQLDDGGARSEAVPGRAVVAGLEVGVHDVVDGEGGEDPAARVSPLHRVPLQRPCLQNVLLPGPRLAPQGWGRGGCVSTRSSASSPAPPRPPRPLAVALTMRSGGGVLPMKHSTLPRSPRTAYCTASLEMMGGPAGGKGGLDRTPRLGRGDTLHRRHRLSWASRPHQPLLDQRLAPEGDTHR